MPTLVALLAASLAGWLVDAPLRATLGPMVSNAASLLVASVAFFFAKRFILGLRGGS